MYWQELTLGLSIVALLSTINLSFQWPRRRFFYILMAIAWLIGIVFNFMIVFFEFPAYGHEMSRIARFFQSLLFAGWFIIDAIEGICQKHACQKRAKKLLERLDKLWTLIQR